MLDREHSNAVYLKPRAPTSFSPKLTINYIENQSCQSNPIEKILDCRLLHFLSTGLSIGLLRFLSIGLKSMNFHRFFSIVCFLNIYIIPKSKMLNCSSNKPNNICLKFETLLFIIERLFNKRTKLNTNPM